MNQKTQEIEVTAETVTDETDKEISVQAQPELSPVPEKELQMVQADDGVSPLVKLFSTGAYEIEQIEKMMQLQDRHDEREAMKAFNDAMAQAKSEMGPVVMTGKSHHGKYPTLSDYLLTANPSLAKYGLSLSWETVQTESTITATTVISHRMGHSKTYSPVTIPIMEGNSSTNAAQMVLQSKTYAERGSISTALGLESEDTDGNPGDPKVNSAKATEPPEYSEARFKKNYPTWKEKVEAGELDPSDIIAELQSRFIVPGSMIKDLNGLKDCVPVR